MKAFKKVVGDFETAVSISSYVFLQRAPIMVEFQLVQTQQKDRSLRCLFQHIKVVSQAFFGRKPYLQQCIYCMSFGAS